MTIALGVVTYNRPEYFAQCMAAIEEHLTGVVDWIATWDDGSAPEHWDANSSAAGPFNYTLSPVNEGVGHAKNHLLTTMLGTGADWLVLSEDDVIVQSPEAVTGYVAAAEASGLDHLAFHAHGPANPPGSGVVDGPVTYWPNSVGARCLYSRRSLEVCGLFDPAFHNSWEHVEHSQRLAQAGFTTSWPRNADATGSENWLAEIPGSIENSSIRHTPEWQAHMEAGKVYWRVAKPGTYRLIWGDG